MRQTPFVVLLLLRDFSVPSEQVCLLSDNLRALLRLLFMLSLTIRKMWLTLDTSVLLQ